jgi:hypothetical protein
MEVSKELLSEVLSYKLSYKIKVHKIIVRTGTLNYFYNIKDSYGGLFEANAYINVYELAFKCKEWLLSKGYYFSIYSFNFSGNTEQEHRVRLLIGNDVVYWGNDSCEETEVETIILASEWIRKEINEKQLQH